MAKSKWGRVLKKQVFGEVLIVKEPSLIRKEMREWGYGLCQTEVLNGEADWIFVNVPSGPFSTITNSI
jgi:hypothetical protein